jgi:hypothetical protein
VERWEGGCGLGGRHEGGGGDLSWGTVGWCLDVVARHGVFVDLQSVIDNFGRLIFREELLVYQKDANPQLCCVR